MQLQRLPDKAPAFLSMLYGALRSADRLDLAAQLVDLLVVKWTYDRSADAAYLSLDPSSSNGPDAEAMPARFGYSLELEGDAKGVHIDIDALGRVVGVEILARRDLIGEYAIGT